MAQTQEFWVEFLARDMAFFNLHGNTELCALDIKGKEAELLYDPYPHGT